MPNYFDKIEEQRKELRKYYLEKSNLRLKYSALISIGLSITLMLAMIFWLDSIPATLLLLMRGFAGLFALVFVALVTVLVYRVNASYIKDRNKH